jgi:hypothetical protein
LTFRMSIQQRSPGLGMKSTPTIDAIRDHVSRVAFGSPLVQNNLRALVVEAIIDSALSPTWRWVSKDWAGWDFEHVESRVRLEVKQSAARQTWKAPPKQKLPLPRFDVRERTGYWDDGATWVAQAGRLAQIYVFAHHPITDDTADHRDALQWRFHVVKASALPSTARTIGLSGLASLSPAQVGWADLFEDVEKQRIAIGA